MIVTKKDLTVNVTIKVDSAPASQILSVAKNVINVLRDFMDFQNVKVGFCYQFFSNGYIFLSFLPAPGY